MEEVETEMGSTMDDPPPLKHVPDPDSDSDSDFEEAESEKRESQKAQLSRVEKRVVRERKRRFRVQSRVIRRSH